MADLKAGTTVGGAMVWTQGNFPLFPSGNTLLYRDYTIYSTNDKPQAADNDFVSKALGGIFEKTITMKGSNASATMMQLQGTAVGVQYNIADSSGALTGATYQTYAATDQFRFRGPNSNLTGNTDILIWDNPSKAFTLSGSLKMATSGRIYDSTGAQVYSPQNKPAASDVGLGNVTNDAQLKVASNLSDVANADTSRSNLTAAKSGANSDITSLTAVDNMSKALSLGSTLKVTGVSTLADTNAGALTSTSLTVSGAGSLASLTVSGNTTIGGTATLNGNMNVTGTSTLATTTATNLTISGTTTLNGNTNAAAITASGLTVTGNITVNGTGNFTATLNAATLNVNGIATATNYIKSSGLWINGRNTPVTGNQGIYVAWNETNGGGEGAIVVNKGGGTGGLNIRLVNQGNTSEDARFVFATGGQFYAPNGSYSVGGRVRTWSVINSGYLTVDVDGGQKGINFFDSDLTLKENVESADEERAIDIIRKTRPVSYKFKDVEYTENDNGKEVKGIKEGAVHQYGVIAQELEKLLPESVITHIDGKKALDPLEMLGLLITVCHKQQKMIDELNIAVSKLS